MRIGSLFSGIGGLELGLEMAGLGPVAWQVEQDPFCREVLAKHWPDAQRHRHVQYAGRSTLEQVDIICGGFPCQDISSAGTGEGLAGDRSGLWFEFARIIDELGPQWVVIENVASGAHRWVDAIREHLARLSYASLPVPLSAELVGAPHRRNRVFVIAYSLRDSVRDGAEWLPRGWPGRVCPEGQAEPSDDGLKGTASDVRAPVDSDDDKQSALPGLSEVALSGKAASPSRRERRISEPEVRRMDDGFPGWVDRNTISPTVDVGATRRAQRIRGLGNAVVPQCAEVIGWMIREMAAL